MFAWFFLSALYMQRVLGYSALQVGLAFLPSNIIMAVCSLGPVGAHRDALRAAAAARRRAALRRRRPGAVRARAGRRPLPRRRAARHAAARPGRRHRLQPAAARGDERRDGERVGSRLGHRQHGVHDGRRAGPGGAGEPGRGTHGRRGRHAAGDRAQRAAITSRSRPEPPFPSWRRRSAPYCCRCAQRLLRAARRPRPRPDRRRQRRALAGAAARQTFG